LEFDTIVLHNGESSGNSGSGLRIIDLNRDGRLDLVTCSANGADGVSVESPSGVGAGRVVVSNGAFGSNGADGLFLEATTGGQIVDCTATNNAGWGIRVLGSNHLIQRNACLGNFGGSLLAAAPGNIVGPMVSEFTVGANTNPAANYE
ncbi:MAG: right-handed parallel beta-helix repeat-containing protein, partial [Phycisphaerales bacterium]